MASMHRCAADSSCNDNNISVTMRVKEASIIAILCAVAALLLCAAVAFLALHAVWPAAAPVLAYKRRPRGSEASSRATAFLNGPIAEMPAVSPLPPGNDGSLTTEHGKQGKRRRQAGHRAGHFD